LQNLAVTDICCLHVDKPVGKRDQHTDPKKRNDHAFGDSPSARIVDWPDEAEKGSDEKQRNRGEQSINGATQGIIQRRCDGKANRCGTEQANKERGCRQAVVPC
jgi:hypothetical protein